MSRRHSLFLVSLMMWILGAALGHAQVAEVAGKVVGFVNPNAATEITAGQWYLVYNRGRSRYDYDDGSAMKQATAGVLAGAEITASNAGYLIKFVSAGTGKYYVQSALGRWCRDFSGDNAAINTTATESERSAYTIGTCASAGHWWMQSASGWTVDGNGSAAVGWKQDIPTTDGGNNDHAFYAVTLNEKGSLTGAAFVNESLKAGGMFRFISQRANTRSITENGEQRLVTQNTAADNQSQWWLLQPLASGGFAMRNWATGNYAQNTGGTSAQYTTSSARSTLYARASNNADATRRLLTISSNSGFSGRTCMHDDDYQKVVNWDAANGTANPASDWEMLPIEGFDATAVKNHFATLSGHTVPTNGAVVQIRNVETGTQISESGTGKLFSIAPNEDDFSQYWVMEAGSNGQYAFRNVQTGHYFTYVSGTLNSNVQTATNSKTFYLLSETNDAWERTYHIRPANTSHYYTHATSGNGPYDVPDNNVYNTTTDDARTHWFFVEVSLSQEEIDRAKQSYQTYSDLNSNKSTYSTRMVSYFTDASCSVLKDTYKNMEPTTLRTTMKNAGLPDYLVDIALKIRNNTWETEDKMSEQFRVNTYKPYSHFLHAVKRTGVGYAFGRLSNPTGIVVKSGDFITLFCGSNQPSGTKLQLEVVEGTESYGTTYNLSQGMNVFSFSGNATLYIFYQIEDQNLTTPLANVPDVKIHIEGGRLQGYYDKTRNHTNDTWAHLRKNLLKESNVINVKMDNFVFCLDNQIVQNNCPDMERTVDVWDKLAKWENDLMGYNDKFNPEISKYQRNIYNWFSKDYYIGGMMMTGLYGVQVMSGYINGMVNHESMESGAWAPAHENGHLRQNLIYTLGSHESSCNLFSEVVTYELGHSTSRSAFSTDIFDKFAAGKPWADYEGSQISRMLYQLYLYFHVAGHDPEFYPKVFTELRKDPMDHSDRDNVHGGSEYLKLATTMCRVANADLSEFFAAYGFFVPLSTRTYYENGSTWKISTTQAEIDAALAEMHSYSKKLDNIVFIEDRVEQVPATYADAPAGTMKSGYDPAKAGDVGQYTAYTPGHTVSLTDYYYSEGEGGAISVHGTGAQGLVGFKIYDANDKLVGLSNFLNFDLPASLVGKSYKVKAAMSNGTDILLTLNNEAPVTPDPDPEPEPEAATDWAVTMPAQVNVSVASTPAARVVAATAAADNSHWYVMQQNRGDRFTPVYDCGAGQNIKRHSDASASLIPNGTEYADAMNVYLVRAIPGEFQGTYKLQFATGRYFGYDHTGNLILSGGGTPIQTRPFDESDNFIIYNKNGVDQKIGISLTTDGTTHTAKLDNNGIGETISYWGSGIDTNTGGNNTWSFYPVSFTELGGTPDVVNCDIVYTLTHSTLGTVTTAPISVRKGEAYPTLDIPYGVSITFPEGKVTQSETINLTYTIAADHPLTFYNDVESFDDIHNWYKLSVRDKWVGSKEGEGEDRVRDVWSTAEPSHFAFMGTPWGFTIYDYEMNGWLGGRAATAEAPIVYDEDEAMQFVFENNDGHYGFRLKSTTNGYLNNLEGVNSHKLGYWLDGSSSTDLGSTFLITRYSLYSIGELTQVIELAKLGWITMEEIQQYIDLLLEREK